MQAEQPLLPWPHQTENVEYLTRLWLTPVAFTYFSFQLPVKGEPTHKKREHAGLVSQSAMQSWAEILVATWSTIHPLWSNLSPSINLGCCPSDLLIDIPSNFPPACQV